MTKWIASLLLNTVQYSCLGSVPSRSRFFVLIDQYGSEVEPCFMKMGATDLYKEVSIK